MAIRTTAEGYGPQGRSAWLDIDWREHQRTLEIDGRRVNYVEMGSGPPLVFVHGLSGSWPNWLENIPEFARDHRVLAVDLPGFGHSQMPREKITISDYGVWLDRFCDAVGVERGVFVGNSMGGFISAELAIKFPARVERLVLVAAAGLSIEHMRNDGVLRALEVGENLIQFGLAQFLAQSKWVARRPRAKRAALWFVAAHPDRLPAALTWEQMQGSGKPGFLPALDALTSYPIRERIPDISCPTLIVWGDKDRLVPLKDAHEFDRLIPDSRLIVYADTGHVPMLERPERFNSDVRAFVTAPSAAEETSTAYLASTPERSGLGGGS